MAAFLMYSWPIVYYPLTDGDIVNWARFASKIHHVSDLLSVESDQSHGPLMVWSGALFLSLFGSSFYALNFFNLLMGLLGVALVYYFSRIFFNSSRIAALSTFIFSISIAGVYLSRTPMYDWAATMGYFSFCGFYYLYLIRNQKWDFVLAMFSIGIGSLSRFSICLVLAGIFMVLLQFRLKRSWWSLFSSVGVLVVVVVSFNFFWFWSQFQQYGYPFVKSFIYDNTGRYIKSTRPDATVRFDFYGFPLYVLLGMLPFTFCLLVSNFQKKVWSRIKSSHALQVVLIGFLPCLLLFSFSGHTKLARYIAYVFPFLSMYLGALMGQYDLRDFGYRKKCGRMIVVVMLLLVLILIQQAIQFSAEVQQSWLFVFGVFFLLLSLLGYAYYLVVHRYDVLEKKASVLIWPAVFIYCVFFTILAIEARRAEFLLWVTEGIQSVL